VRKPSSFYCFGGQSYSCLGISVGTNERDGYRLNSLLTSGIKKTENPDLVDAVSLFYVFQFLDRVSLAFQCSEM
jgi:hypothetical protein